MMKKKPIFSLTGPLLMLLIVIAGISGCTTNECYDNQNSLPLAGFYSSEETPQSISMSAITIYGIGAPGDSILQDSVNYLSEVYLPFRIDQESTSYVIKYLQGDLWKYDMADTITFNYDIVPWFVSTACGAVYDYKITNIETTHLFIDSVTCPTGEITNVNMENLKIFFRVNIGN